MAAYAAHVYDQLKYYYYYYYHYHLTAQTKKPAERERDPKVKSSDRVIWRLKVSDAERRVRLFVCFIA